MPNMDGTGPRGEGPRTGWGKGKCKDSKSNRVETRQGGRGIGRKFRFRNLDKDNTDQERK